MWNTLLGLACSLYWTQNTTFFVTFKEREKQKERPMRKKKNKNAREKLKNKTLEHHSFIHTLCCSTPKYSLLLLSPTAQFLSSSLSSQCVSFTFLLFPFSNLFTGKLNNNAIQQQTPASRTLHAYLLLSPLIFLALKPLSKPCVCIRHKRTTRQQQQKTTHNIDCQIMATFSQDLLKYHVGELSSLSICHQIKFAIMLQMWCDEQCVVGVFGVALLYFRNPSASLHTFFVTHFSWASALLTIKLQNSY